MSKRNLVAALLLTVLPVSLVACGGDDDESGDATTTTTEAEAPDGTGGDDSSPDTTDATDEAPDDTEGQVGFDDGVKEARDKIESASELCDVWEINNYLASVGQPEGRDQVKAAVEVTAGMWRKMADTAPDSISAEAEVLRGLADEFEQGAEGVDYDFDKVSALDVLDSEEAQQAQQKFAEVASVECRDDSTTPGG